MKGVVFTEFMELVEDKFSFETADKIVEGSDLASGGAYTSLGTYDHEELLKMVTLLSEMSDAPIPDLVRTFGLHLANRFAAAFPQFFENTDYFRFLEGVDGYIHVEVRKLYADAELPKFDTERVDENVMVMHYSSARPFADLAHGLVLGTAEYFGEAVDVDYQDTSPEHAPGTKATFTITRK